MSALSAEYDDVQARPADFDLRDYMDGVTAFLGGPANVILQLGHPAVGHGVVEKPREAGSVMRHPFKRLRTTFSYLSVATMGDEDDRRAMREAVNFSHKEVRSDPGGAVKFNAFDPMLQLWVAASIYFGFVDTYQRMHGPLDDATADLLYEESSRLGTTLQMPEHFWPANRADFEEFWQQGLTEIRFDPEVRVYLLRLLQFKQLHPLMRLGAGQLLTWTNTGLLPAEVREKLDLEWSRRDELAFTVFMRGLGLGYRVLPRIARNFPFNYFLWDVRRRARNGKPIV
jgi:uncharacterized protein (DUF2236 family)